jgi:hypothetical protein
MRELELSRMHAPAAHPVAAVEARSPVEIKDLESIPADIAPPQVVEVASPHHPTSPPRGGEVPETKGAHVPLPWEGERLGEGEDEA